MPPAAFLEKEGDLRSWGKGQLGGRGRGKPPPLSPRVPEGTASCLRGRERFGKRTPPGRGSPGPGWGQACVLGTRQGEPLCVSRVSAPLQKTGCGGGRRGGRWPCACLARRGARAPADRWLSGVRFLPRYLKPGSWLLAPGGRAGAAAACVTRMRNRDPDWGRAPMATAVVALETNLQAARPQGPPRVGPQLPAEALGWEGGDQACPSRGRGV